MIRIAKDFDTALSWDDLIYTIEFKYGEGFEFEKLMPFCALSLERQAFVSAQQPLATRIVVEKVYSIRKVSYEAYFNTPKTNWLKK